MKAVIFIDVQNDFVTGALANPAAQKVVPQIVEFAKQCVQDGNLIYATRDTHTKDYLSTLEGKKLPVEHCIEGTDGWQIVDGLAEVLQFNCRIVNKTTFGSVDLPAIVGKDEPDEIVLCGFCTSICVAANAVLLRAAFPNTKITVLKDLCACVTEESHNAALKVLEMQQIEVK